MLLRRCHQLKFLNIIKCFCLEFWCIWCDCKACADDSEDFCEGWQGCLDDEIVQIRNWGGNDIAIDLSRDLRHWQMSLIIPDTLVCTTDNTSCKRPRSFCEHAMNTSLVQTAAVWPEPAYPVFGWKFHIADQSLTDERSNSRKAVKSRRVKQTSGILMDKRPH